MLVFVVTPLVLILANAFIYNGKFSFKNFAIFFTEKSSLVVLGNSILVGLLTTIICIVLGYPAAYFLAKYSASKIFVLLFILPMWVNFLIRTLATKAIFVSLNIPLGMGTVVFGMVYNYLPFMILPLHTVLSSIDKNYIEAAEDLGADKFQVSQNDIAVVGAGDFKRNHDGVHSHDFDVCDKPAFVGQHSILVRRQHSDEV